MTRFERRQMFEKLLDLRARYREGQDDDRLVEMSIVDTIAWAEALLTETTPGEFAPEMDQTAASDGEPRRRTHGSSAGGR
jgi:hypothetical protein